MSMLEESHDRTLLEILRGERASVENTPAWLQKIDDWSTRLGDKLNPILVKETRQALKSRQFVTTFSLLLFASLAWTIIGSLQGMPEIYHSPSAPRMLIGYYLLLAVPMLMVVPLAAYRSLESEVDEGTLDLLSITSLTPMQIITGKLASAALQMMLYLVVLFPSVAYAYTLRGVDLPTLALLMVMLVASGLMLIIVALFFAPVTGGRTGQITSLLAVTAILVTSEFAIGPVAFSLIRTGNPLPPSDTLVLLVATLALGASFCFVLLMSTAARLTPESENRSTGIRVAILGHMFITIAVCVFVVRWFYRPQSSEQLAAIPIALGVYLAAFWAVVGALLCSESAVMTPRIRRELPGSFLGRLLLTWLTPGPATGLVFSTVTLTGMVAASHLLLQQVARTTGWFVDDLGRHRTLCVLVVAYLTIAFLGVRLIIAFLRARYPVDVRVGIAAISVTMMLLTVGPYAIQSFLNDYRTFAYSPWQATNWAWTLRKAYEDDLDALVIYLIVGTAAALFLFHLLLLGQRVLPQRLATPQRVEREYRRLAGLDLAVPKPSDPLGLASDDLKA